MDSILGALTLPDIGQLFPDNDAKWRGADRYVLHDAIDNELYIYTIYSLMY